MKYSEVVDLVNFISEIKLPPYEGALSYALKSISHVIDKLSYKTIAVPDNSGKIKYLTKQSIEDDIEFLANDISDLSGALTNIKTSIYPIVRNGVYQKYDIEHDYFIMKYVDYRWYNIVSLLSNIIDRFPNIRYDRNTYEVEFEGDIK